MVAKTSVGDYMVPLKELVCFGPDMEMLEAIDRLLDNRISGAPVVDEKQRLIGMLSEKDCLHLGLSAHYHNIRGGLVKDFMSGNVQTVDVSASIVNVSEQFIACHFRCLPVVDRLREDKFVGQVSRRDLLRAVSNL
ncbi:MAG: CBS domain-containing protein [Alphaproteobacteria bacterium]|nr:CBS domain-containing protein [Alphaproteobacteria bacterium]